MKIVYLHDESLPSLLSKLKEAFPTIEILAPNIEGEPSECLDSLENMLENFNRKEVRIVADGIGCYYCLSISYTLYLLQSILINPDLKSISNISPIVEEKEINVVNRTISLYDSEKASLIKYHEINRGGDYLVTPSSELINTIISLIEKSMIGTVHIHYLRTPIRTPQGQILPVNVPFVSIYGHFNWFGEDLSVARIPTTALKYRDHCCIIPSPQFLVPGDVVHNLEEISSIKNREISLKKVRFYKYLRNYTFKNLITGKTTESVFFPYFHCKGYFLPDLATRWSLKTYVSYDICVPFTFIKKIGYDKYGNRFQLLDKGRLPLLRKQHLDAIVKSDSRVNINEYVIGTFPDRENPEQEYILPYSDEGIMCFKKTPKTCWGEPIAKILEERKKLLNE